MSATAAAVALLATATLSFEILLVRVFAVEHFHHVAYMAIGVAMLGIGASGAVVAAVSIAAPSYRLGPEELAAAGERCAATGREVSALLGFRPHSDPD
jgi:hypothetical protein